MIQHVTKLCHVLTLLAVVLATLGNPICDECPKGHYLDWTTCKCHKCPKGEYNKSPGRATRCQPCRKLCFDEIQNVTKQCTSEHDIWCECPNGKVALTQQDRCFNRPGTRSASFVHTKGRRMVPIPTPLTLPVPSHQQTTATPSATPNVSGEQSTNNMAILGYIFTPLFWVLLLGVCVVYIWKKFHLTRRLFKRVKRKFSNSEQLKKNKRLPNGRQSVEIRLRPEFIHIAERLSPNKRQMFLRLLPGQKLTDPYITDLNNRCNTTPEFIYQGLTRWLEINKNVTREHLVEALKSGKENTLAEEVGNLPKEGVADAPGGLADPGQGMQMDNWRPGGDEVAAEEASEAGERGHLLESDGMEPSVHVGGSGQDGCSITFVKQV